MTPPDTPLPVKTVRVLSIAFTFGAVVSLAFSLPETDHRGREHVLTHIQRYLKDGVEFLTTVDEEEANRIREQRRKKS